MWIDDPERVTLSYERDKNSSTPIVDTTVFAVGSDERFLVVQQHPGGDRKTTNFFIIDVQKYDSNMAHNGAVVGPLSEADFLIKQKELSLPPFTKELTSLR